LVDPDQLVCPVTSVLVIQAVQSVCPVTSVLAIQAIQLVAHWQLVLALVQSLVLHFV